MKLLPCQAGQGEGSQFWYIDVLPALRGGDSFSLIASYADALAGLPLHARGGRHNPNY
jgi:hypothetical protein